MTRPRSQLVSLEATPYYHCIARCVRRSWLCGSDRYSGKNFDHRKPWVLDRLKLLAEIFAIDIAAYAVMSNHYHVVLHVDVTRANSWSDDQVIKRWTSLYTGPDVVRYYNAEKPLSAGEIELLKTIVARWRERLSNISWFMRCLNEYLARKANAEDGCKGRFWEARFKSQALLDETAVLSCMTYVDLNPIRAGMAEDLLSSDFTSIQQRIKNAQGKSGKKELGNDKNHTPRIMPFTEVLHKQQTLAGIPFNFQDYLELADWTRQAIQQDKKCTAPENHPQLLKVLRLTNNEWQFLALQIQKQAITMLHGINRLRSMKNSKLVKRVA
ncbi:MAG: transposase [Pseudomonadales bacterium]|nr:transposase [Pseudomonadales bacterium]